MIHNYMIMNYFYQIGSEKILYEVLKFAIPIFGIQALPTFVYGCFKYRKMKLRAALIVWGLPMIVSLFQFGIIFIPIYLFVSPVCAILDIPEFHLILNPGGKNPITREGEDIISQMAVVGWFNIFWMLIIVRNIWLKSKNK
jgi:hypothetical protein